MVLLPEEKGMTLAELRQIAARQQHQIDAQQQLLVAKEQRLKFLKQQEARHHNLSEQHLDTKCLITLRDKVEAQELKLRQLRALRSQVDQQKTNNSNLGTELESIRALFCEKEKELNLAVNKVEELSRQLDEVKKGNKRSYLTSSAAELEKLQRELSFCTKISAERHNYICQQREKISNRQQDIAILDKKINELNKRLHRKRLLNEQYASQIHQASLSHITNGSNLQNSVLAKIESRVPEILEAEHAQDDLAANLHGHLKCDFGEFSLTKNDPKYQTLPYNTKFTLKDKQQEDSSSSSASSTEDESCQKTEDLCERKDAKPFSNMCNFSPRPFQNAFNSTNSGVQKVHLPVRHSDVPSISQDTTAASDENICAKNTDKKEDISNDSPNSVDHLVNNNIKPNKQTSNKPDSQSLDNVSRASKPAIPPKPALSVKPLLVHRESNQVAHKKKESPGQESVNMALTFLKNKSTEKEKSDFRYPTAKDSSQDPLLPKSRILTYFSKTLLQPETGAHDQNGKTDAAGVPKRKPNFGQLPIKPKPLTIRKTPGIEPPKLKAQSVTSSAAHRHKMAESQPLSFSSKASKCFPPSEADEKSAESSSKKSSDSVDACIEPQSQKYERGGNQEDDALAVLNGTDQESDDSPDIRISKEESPSEETSLSNQSDADQSDSSLLQSIKKGNLKGDGCSIRVSRRVSFDPLALLLDAALEGELELVKKIASEVVNPSAANDEGITALHNAICAGQFEVVKFLVEFGCDVNAPDSDGWTPLHCAASCNNLPMVKFLVERGACIFATTLSDQETAAEKCEEDGAGFDSCSEYLFSLQENLGVMNNGKVYAVYDYDVQNADELSFRNGDVLTVLRRSDDEENEWWWCRLEDEEGYVPRNLLGLYPRVTCANPS